MRKESGQLQQSISSSASGKGADFELLIKSSSVYFKTHAEGKTITPKSRRVLTIPTGNAAGRAARARFKSTGDPHVPPGMYFVVGSTLKEFGTKQTSHTLRTSVTIPRRINVSQFTLDFFRKQMGPALGKFLVKELERG